MDVGFSNPYNHFGRGKNANATANTMEALDGHVLKHKNTTEQKHNISGRQHCIVRKVC